jgi:putative hemolysin
VESDPGTPLLVLAVLMLVHGFFAAGEVAVLSVAESRLNQMPYSARRFARLVASLAAGNAIRLLTTTRLAIKVCGFLAVALAVSVYSVPLAAWLAGPGPALSSTLSQAIAVTAIVVALVLVSLVVGDLLPRTLARRYPEPISRLAIYPLSVLAAIAAPLTRLTASVTRLMTGRPQMPGSTELPLGTEEQIKTLVDAGEEEGVIEEEEKEMIYSIFDLGDTLAREVMVPRIDIVALEVKTSLKEALRVIVQAGHSRIPVYEDEIDSIVGILYAKDLLKYWPDFESLNLRDILREAYYVPETKPVDELLQELQQRKVHIVIVVDEYGGVAGLVTIEDVLEEIVGEIQDEYDSEESFVEVVSPDEVIFDGRTDLDDINDAMSIDLPTDTSDTVGGLVNSGLGRVATVGDRVRFGDVELTVLSMLGRRIKKVQVNRLRCQMVPAPSEGQTGPDATQMYPSATPDDTPDIRPPTATPQIMDQGGIQ